MVHRALPYLPVLLLAAVAVSQRYYVHAHGLSAWKGGGFGMFSTPIGNRELTATFVLQDNRQVRLRRSDIFRLDLPTGVKRNISALGMMPSAENFDRVVSAFNAQNWSVVPPEHLAESPESSTGLLLNYWPIPSEKLAADRAEHALQVQAVTIELWEYAFNDTRDALVLKRIAAHVLER